MKRIVFTLTLVFLAGIASAQETYSISVGGATTNRNSIVGQLELGRTQTERRRLRPRLPSCLLHSGSGVRCPQRHGGASCTAGDALAAHARIYPASLAGPRASSPMSLSA